MQDAAGQTIHRRDLVKLITSPNQQSYGMVLRGKPGRKVVVQLVDGTAVTADAGDVRVADRSYLRPGMTVVSTSQNNGDQQLGVVTGADVELDLVRLDNGGERVVSTVVSPVKLRRVRELCMGDYVVSGSGHWLGRVFEVSLDVDVLFDDGAACRVQQAEGKLWPVNGRDSQLNPCTNTVFSPGHLVGGRSSVFRSSRWLTGHWKPSRSTGTLSKVETSSVLVYWVASSSPQAAMPAHQQSPQDLTFFSAGDSLSFWSVGDQCFWSDVPCTAVTRTRRMKPNRLGAKRRTQQREIDRPMSVAGTRTTVDVLWQDGTRRLQVPSASLAYTARQDIHEFFPGQRVVYRGGETTATRVGVVRSLKFKDQTVRVSWLEEDDETVVSTYDLGRSFDSNNVFYGDVVVRHTEDATARAAGDLSWVGHVVDFCDTDRVQVKWGDGKTSEVLFDEIAVVKDQSTVELLREIGKWMPYEQDGDSMNSAPAAVAGAQETIAHAEDDGGEQDNKDGRGATTRMDQVRLVVQTVIRVAGKILAQGRRYLSVSGSTVAEVMPEQLTAIDNTNNVATQVLGSETSTAGSGINGVTTGSGDADADDEDDKSGRFPKFDLLHQSPPDHHYIDNMEQGTGGGRNKWTKRVQKEWKILENDLPETIYVQAFEDRMDLLRVAMVGASGTPYHDGLFFFDLQLPLSYPAVPPLVSYRSFGLHVNPNLYPSGTVCLSLLDTFGGHGSELWSPDASSLLQVVVSIQGLVLNAQPYYNEASHAAQSGTSEGRRNELPYSENAYLLTLQTMLHLLRRPPMGFEGFLRDHFLRRGRHVLQACRAYVVERCLVGSLDGDGCPTLERQCSVGFRLALTNMVPRLVEAFTAIGAPGCEHVWDLETNLCITRSNN